MKKWFYLSCFLFGPSILLAQTPITNIADFRSCLLGTLVGYSTVCPLTSGTFSVSSPLLITVPGLTITGSTTAPTVLQRTGSNVPYIMQLQECNYHGCTANSPSGITIEYLTFDGNRAQVQSDLGNSTFCAESQSNYVDLMLDSGTQYNNPPAAIVTVYMCDFKNAPAQSVELDGTTSGMAASVIEYCNSGTGGSSTGARYTGILLEGQSSGAYYNDIEYQGTAALTVVSGYHNYVYGNTMDNDRYEMSDGSGGGTMVLYPASDTAQVAANWIDSENLYTGGGYTFRGCTVPASQSAEGIEIGGASNVYLYNNQIQNNYAVGIEVNADYSPSITFSGSNPWNGGDPYKCMTTTGWRGIWFYGTGSGTASATFSDVCVKYTTGYGIELNYVTGTGFTNNSCMHDNSSGNINTGTSVSLTNSAPGNFTTCNGTQ